MSAKPPAAPADHDLDPHRLPRQGRDPGPGAALHPQVPRQDHGHQVRRQRHDRPGAAAGLCRGRGAAQAGRHEPGGGARRRPADRRGAAKRLGKKGNFIQGMRVTDAETMEVVEWVLGGEVQQDIVGLINEAGGKAVGLTGRDGGLIRAQKLKMLDNDDPSKEHDVGQVGEIESHRPERGQGAAGRRLHPGHQPDRLWRQQRELQHQRRRGGRQAGRPCSRPRS